MKRQTHCHWLPALSLAAVVGSAPARAATFDDIQLWAGSGNNRAALVIDWNDGNGPESLLWGFRWDGAATGLDMLQAVIAADPRLHAHFSEFSWGIATLGIGYDLNASGDFAVSPNLSFDETGIARSSGDANASDARSAADPADHYREGWNSGFWAYYFRSGDSQEWESATSGPTDRLLADGDWDGFSFAPEFNGPAPDEPVAAAIPEPAAVHIAILGLAITLCARRRRP